MNNIDRDLVKCKKIYQLTQSLSAKIHEIIATFPAYATNKELSLAAEIFASFTFCAQERENENYVAFFRSRLILGLNALNEFFSETNYQKNIPPNKRPQFKIIVQDIASIEKQIAQAASR